MRNGGTWWTGLVALVVGLGCGVAAAGEMHPALVEQLARAGARERVRVLVHFGGGTDAAPASMDADAPRAQRRAGLLEAWRARHASISAGVAAIVGHAARAGRGAWRRDLWIADTVEVEVEAQLVSSIAALPEVDAVDLVRVAAVVVPVDDGPDADDTPPAVYGVRRIRAPQAWALGSRGAGAVIGVIDSGFKRHHPDLEGRWRAANGWYDALGRLSAPDDENGHGTHVTGTLVGRRGAGSNFIGVAPDAQVIACRAFGASGSALNTDIYECLQWIADPDFNPWTDDAPDVLNGSWGSETDACDPVMDQAVTRFRSLGIAPVFSAGNDGVPHDPASSPGAITVGAIDREDQVPWWSGHGWTRCRTKTYPDFVAPGTRVRSAWPGGERKNLRGTSMAAPHVSGTIALLRSRRPALTVDEIEQILRATSVDLAAPGLDPIAGYGLVDAYRASLCLDHGSFSGCHAQCP